MRVLALVLLFVCLCFSFADAGVVRHVLKPAAKGSSYPFRHPKKTLKNSARAAAHAFKKVLY